MKKIKLFINFINESVITEKRFVVIKDKFQLFLGDNLVAESGFNILQPDEWFNQKYVILFKLKTYYKYKGKGFAEYLLKQIFNYVTNELKLNIITLLVNKDNYKATNLYFKCGFEIFMEYDDNSYSLIKKLSKDVLYEYVDSKDVGSPEAALKSVINKDRLVAFLGSKLQNDDLEEIVERYSYLDYIQLFEEGTIEYKKALKSKMEFFDSVYQAKDFLTNLYIVYVNTDEGEKNANELASIIRRNDGSMVDLNGNKESQIKDHIRVGELLDYNPEKIREFLLAIKMPKELVNKYMPI